MKGSSLRSLFIIIAVLIAVGLYFAPSQINTKPKSSESLKPNAEQFDVASLIAIAKKSLSDEQQGYVAALETQLATNESNIAAYDSLGKAWDEAGIPALSAYYFEEKAKQVPNEKNYLNASYRYFDAFKIAQDSLIRSQMVNKAIVNYKKVLEFNPGNLNAKTDLGVCYAEGTAEPMKGIMMLREVISTDPNHEMAQLNLAFLSMRSNQIDKAIDRFNKVMQINPKRTEVMYYLASAYIELGKNDSAVYWFQKFKSVSDNYQMVQQADLFIKQLKTIN